MKLSKGRLHSLFLALWIAAAICGPAAAQPDEQQFHIAGLDGEVTIRFDAYGIPHIYASTARDLFAGQGFVHASDRWWQMEWYRHTGMGRVTELVGQDAITQDTFIRTLGLPGYAARDVAALPDDAKILLEAYSMGINAWLDGKTPDDLAPEYALLGLRREEVEPWQLADSMVLQSLQALSFNESSILAEVVSGLVVQSVGSAFSEFVLPPYPYTMHPVTMDPGKLSAQPASGPPAAFGGAFDFLADFQMTGSNAWVVAGHMADTGMPLLANDSHMGVRMPSFWYQVGLHCTELSAECPYDAAGFSIPGSPGIIIGHNQRVGWGFTNAQTDMADFYRLKLHPDNPHQYLYNGDYVDMALRTEMLYPAGADPVAVDIRETVFGPVFEQFDGLPLGGSWALRWAAADGITVLEAIFAANRATNWDEFQQAFALFSMPGMNVLYADVEGNIGYLLSGVIPVRAAEHTGVSPVSGIDDTYQWQGYVPPQDTPRLFNPDTGYILSANNAMIRDDAFPHPIAYFYDYGYRAARIEQLLQAQPVHSVESFRQIQLDGYNPAAAFTLPALDALMFDDAVLNDAVDWLLAWDYQNDADSAQAALFNMFWAKLLLLGLDELPLYEQSHSMYLIDQMLNAPLHPLWPNLDAGLVNGEDVLRAAMQQAWAEMVARFGPNRQVWYWGELHTVSFEPAVYKYIEAGEAAPVVSVGGGLCSPNATTFDPLRGGHEVRSLPSMRMILDFGDFDRSFIINSTGQSGDARTAHYEDMVPLWASGVYLPHAFSQDFVEAQTQKIWHLSD